MAAANFCSLIKQNILQLHSFIRHHCSFLAIFQQIFLCEISTPRLRGFYSSSAFTSFSVGVMLVYSLGSYLHWQTVAGLLAVLPLMSLICLFFSRETPVWLAKNGQVQKAKDSLTWLRGDEYQVRSVHFSVSLKTVAVRGCRMHTFFAIKLSCSGKR